MHQSVNGRCCCHRILEYLLPARKRQIAAQQHAAPFITLRQQHKQHFHFLPALLHIAQVIHNQHLVSRQAFQHSAQLQIALGCQQLLHQQSALGKQHPPACPYQFLAQRTQQVRLARARLAEHQHILMLINEQSLQQRPGLLHYFGRQPLQVQGLPTLLQGQP